jgi:uncharacterized protein with GYD domain
MAKYLLRGNYVASGVKGLMAEGGTKRRDAAAAAIKSAGGTLDAFYFAFGDTDVFAVADLPDNAAAAALGLSVTAAGGAKVRTVVLLTPEEIDAATGKSVRYTPPGG